MDRSGVLNRYLSPSPGKSEESEAVQVARIKARIAMCRSELNELTNYLEDLEIEDSTKPIKLHQMSLWSTYGEGLWNIYFDLNVKLAELCPDDSPDIDAVRNAYFVVSSALRSELKLNGVEHKPPKNFVVQ